MTHLEIEALYVERDVLEENYFLARRELKKANAKVQFLLHYIAEHGLVLTPAERDKMSKLS